LLYDCTQIKEGRKAMVGFESNHCLSIEPATDLGMQGGTAVGSKRERPINVIFRATLRMKKMTGSDSQFWH